MPLNLELDYIKRHGLIGTLAGSAMQAGRDIGASYMGYIDPALRLGSSAILQGLFGTRERERGALQFPQQLGPITPTMPGKPTTPGLIPDLGGPRYKPPVAPQPAQAQTRPVPRAQPMAKALAPAPEEGTLAAAREEPAFEDWPRPYGASVPTGMEGALAAERKKQGNIDALIVALGEIGASFMGPHKDAWQAELGRTASGLARSRVFAGAMEQALAGEIPEHTEILTPEQQIQISQAVVEKRAMGLKEREVVTGEERVGIEREQVEQVREHYRTADQIDRDKLTQEAVEWPTRKRLMEAETKSREAMARMYDKEADEYARKAGIDPNAAEFKDATAFALDYVDTHTDELTTADEKARIFREALDAYKKKSFESMKGITTPTPSKKSSDYLNMIR